MFIPTLDIDLYEQDFPLTGEEAECPSCNQEGLTISREDAKTPPWECKVCNQLYLPQPEQLELDEVEDLLIRLLQGNMARRPECSNCKETVKRENFAENIKELISIHQGSIEETLLYQLSSVQDIAFWECPHCGESADFYSNQRPRT